MRVFCQLLSLSLAETRDFFQVRIIVTTGVELVAKPLNGNNAVDNLAGNDGKQSPVVQRIAGNAIQRLNHFTTSPAKSRNLLTSSTCSIILETFADDAMKALKYMCVSFQLV